MDGAIEKMSIKRMVSFLEEQHHIQDKEKYIRRLRNLKTEIGWCSGDVYKANKLKRHNRNAIAHPPESASPTIVQTEFDTLGRSGSFVANTNHIELFEHFIAMYKNLCKKFNVFTE